MKTNRRVVMSDDEVEEEDDDEMEGEGDADVMIGQDDQDDDEDEDDDEDDDEANTVQEGDEGEEEETRGDTVGDQEAQAELLAEHAAAQQLQHMHPTLCASQAARPYLVDPTSLWVEVQGLSPGQLVPKRATRMNIPTSLFKRDAIDFCDMQAPTGCEARAKAAAALLGIPFVGMGMGLRCSSRHEEDVRPGGEDDGDEKYNNRGKRQPPISRYTFIAPGSTESWPQVQFGTEEIMDSTMTSVVAIGVWIFVYDETYSTTALIASVMEGLRKQHAASVMRMAGSRACGRNTNLAAERREPPSLAGKHVDSNFEGTAGLQYQRILNSEGWMRLLNVHSGSSSANNSTGRPCVPNLPQVANTPRGRRPMYGEIKSCIGTLHPLGYEAVCNAKTASGLAFGLVDPLTSELLDVCAAQLDVDTYFHPGNADSFTPFFVASEQRTCFWICSSQDRKSIFDLPLPRALTGSIAPGAPLVHSDSGPSVDKESEKRAVLAHNKKEKAWLSRSVVADRRIKEFEVNTAVAEARKRNEIEALEARKKNEVECELLKSTTDTLLFKLKTAEGYGMHEEVITLKRKLRTLLG